MCEAGEDGRGTRCSLVQVQSPGYDCHGALLGLAATALRVLAAGCAAGWNVWTQSEHSTYKNPAAENPGCRLCGKLVHRHASTYTPPLSPLSLPPNCTHSTTISCLTAPRGHLPHIHNSHVQTLLPPVTTAHSRNRMRAHPRAHLPQQSPHAPQTTGGA